MSVTSGDGPVLPPALPLMTPGPDSILACPSCGTLVRARSLASGNTFGATLWSDGFFDAPMLPEQPALARCSADAHWFWLGDAHEVGRSFGSGEKEAWAQAPYVPSLAAADYSAALAAGLGSTPDREAFLRLRMWWTANDSCRGTGTLPTPDLDNLERLQTLQALPQKPTTADALRPARIVSADVPDDDPQDAILAMLEAGIDDSEGSDEENESDEEDAPQSERGDSFLHAAVALALGQPDAPRAALVGADLPAEMRQAFMRLVAARDRRVVALE